MSRLFRSARPLTSLAGPSTSARTFHSTRIAREHYLDADAATFKKVVQGGGDKPVLVQFTASWCQPCKMLGPISQRSTGPQSGADLVVIDVDHHGDLAGQYRVTAVPFVVGFKNGKQVDKFIGMQPEAKIKEFISKL